MSKLGTAATGNFLSEREGRGGGSCKQLILIIILIANMRRGQLLEIHLLKS
jgi:hypothetical protein